MTAGVGAGRDTSRAPLLRAARGERPARTPVWFMRQAGRSLPEYRALRRDVPMLEACATPDLVCEITLQPVRRYGVDAAILYSDIVVPLAAAGVGVELVPGTGPVIARPVRSRADVAALGELDPRRLEPVAAAVRLLTAELGATPLIGFAGAPFTLASYLVEGGPSRTYERTKALMHGDPTTWDALLSWLAGVTAAFLGAQVDAGADAVQLFDSWAGALSPADYRRFVLPHSRAVLAAVAGRVPRIHFGVGTGELLGAMREAGAEVSGVDWRVPLDAAAARLRAAGPEDAPVVVQGNLDPALLGAPWPVVEREARRVLAEGRAADGHVFNLGHGVLPSTDPGVLARIVELVHEEGA